MKAKDFTMCLCCGKGVAHAGDLTFLRIHIDYMMLNPRAITRQHGLEQMVGNAALAAVLGPNEDMAARIGSGEGLICGTCMLKPESLATPFSFFEMAQDMATSG